MSDAKPEIWFYHLERSTLEQVLPGLMEKTRERGWRALVRAADSRLLDDIDERLWTYRDDSFLPHGTKADGFPDLQPVWLTGEDENPNNANIRFYVDGAAVGEIGGLTRAVIMFDGNDQQAVDAAREGWKRFKAAGHEVSYWQQDEQGRWQNRAAGK